MIKHNITGILKLKDELSVLNYGLYNKTQYFELSEIFNNLVDREIFIKIKDIKHDLVLLKTKGVLVREKIGKQYILKVGDTNLDDLLWNLTETKLSVVIECEGDIDEQDESEDITKWLAWKNT